jgi:phage tail-like protein
MADSKRSYVGPNRSYAAAHFALELDGKTDIGLFRSIEGGGVRADVMTYQQGAVYDRWRQLGKPKFEDIKLQVGMSMSKAFYEWITGFFTGKGVRKTGAIIAADFSYNERARREFKAALIKELTFPKLDGSDKNAAYLNVSLSVEDILFKPGVANQKLSPGAGAISGKLWTACNFLFHLDDFADNCRNVSKIDSFTVKQNIIEYHQGGQRAPTKTPSSMDYPNLTFYLPEADAGPFFKRVEERISKGELRPKTTMNGHIQTYDNDRSPLFTINFMGGDIISVSPDKSEASSEEIKQVKVEMYIEKMEFDYAKMNVQ